MAWIIVPVHASGCKIAPQARHSQSNACNLYASPNLDLDLPTIAQTVTLSNFRSTTKTKMVMQSHFTMLLRMSLSSGTSVGNGKSGMSIKKSALQSSSSKWKQMAVQVPLNLVKLNWLLTVILKRNRNRNKRGKKRLTERNKRKKRRRSATKQLQNIRLRTPWNYSVRKWEKMRVHLTIQLMIQILNTSASGRKLSSDSSCRLSR